MTKLTGPLLSLAASGSIKNRLTFSERKTGPQARFQRAQKDVLTAGRITQRQKYVQGVSFWKTLTDDEKYGWRVLAIGKPFSGFNLFMKNWLLGLIVIAQYLLLEDGNLLLQEDGNKIKL